MSNTGKVFLADGVNLSFMQEGEYDFFLEYISRADVESELAGNWVSAVRNPFAVDALSRVLHRPVPDVDLSRLPKITEDD